LALYGVSRFLVEFVRVPDEHIGYLAGGWFTEGQLLSAPMIVGGVALLLWAYRVRAPSAISPSHHETVLELMRRIGPRACARMTATGTGTLSVFGHQMHFDLARGFPLVTTKKIHVRSVVVRAAVVPARRHQRRLAARAWRHDLGRMADANGELGPVYGSQWRAWPAADGRAIDQIAQAVERSRPILIRAASWFSAWNVGELERMRLMPCHAFSSSTWPRTLVLPALPAQRGCVLGVPFNIASYALLTHLFAQQCDLKPGELIWTGGDCHLYLNHLERRTCSWRARRSRCRSC